jgi:hypothetical protein
MIASMINQQLLSIYQQRFDLQIGRDPRDGGSEHSELETMLGIGLLLFQNTRDRHLAWYADVQAERVACEIETAEEFAKEYERWNEATEFWLGLASELERRGVHVEHLKAIHGVHEELKLVELDVRTLTRRWEKLEEGKGVDAREFFASLRSCCSA